MKYKPVEVNEFSDTALMIVWDDGHESIYLYEDLREACPCATCRKQRASGKGVQKPLKKTIPLRLNKGPVKPVGLEPVGQYAYKFSWSDKHDTGIYTFEFLRDMCSCEECRKGAT